jgi:hypothetical protein
MPVIPSTLNMMMRLASVLNFTDGSTEPVAVMAILPSEGIPQVAPQCDAHMHFRTPPKEEASPHTHPS